MYLHVDSKSLLHHCRAASRDWLVPELCRVLRICCLLPFQLLNSLVRSTKLCTLQGKLKIMKHQNQSKSAFPNSCWCTSTGKLWKTLPKLSSSSLQDSTSVFGSFFPLCKGNRIPQGHLFCNHGRGIGRSSFSDFGHFQGIGQVCFQFADLSLTKKHVKSNKSMEKPQWKAGKVEYHCSSTTPEACRLKLCQPQWEFLFQARYWKDMGGCECPEALQVNGAIRYAKENLPAYTKTPKNTTSVLRVSFSWQKSKKTQVDFKMQS